MALRHATENLSKSLKEEVQRWGSMKQTRVSLKCTMEFHSRPKDKSFLISVQFLDKELPRRIARRVVELKNLPTGLSQTPAVLKDPYWEKLLMHCVDNGSYQGCPLSPLERQDFPCQYSSHFLPHDIEKPNSEVVQRGENPLKSSKQVERVEEASEQYNDEDDDYNTKASKQYTNEKREWLENVSNVCSDKNDTADSSALNDSSIDTYVSTEAEMKNETNNFSGAGHENSIPFMKEIEWDGITCTSTGWDD